MLGFQSLLGLRFAKLFLLSCSSNICSALFFTGLVFVFSPAARGSLAAETVSVIVAPGTAPRVLFGASRLVIALKTAGFESSIVRSLDQAKGRRIIVGNVRQAGTQKPLSADALKLPAGEPGREGFVLSTSAGGPILVAGGDDSGALYGCLELARRVRNG